MTESNHHTYFKRTDGKASLALFLSDWPIRIPEQIILRVGRAYVLMFAGGQPGPELSAEQALL